jgi:hypothetical protein
MSETIRITNQLVTTPFMVREDLHVTKQLVRGAPWMPPPFSGLQAVRAATGESVLIVAGEMPIHLFPWGEDVSKEKLEELHLAKFATDYCIATGRRRYHQLRRGAEPPDFVASLDGRELSIDCIQFALATRRKAQGLFSSVRRAVRTAGPDNFEHLNGLLVYVWVDTPKQQLDLPLRHSEQQELVKALAEFRFSSEMGQTLGSGVPDQAPEMGIQQSPAGWRFYATPIISAAPSSLFFIEMGFELAFNYPTEHVASDAWAEFERLILQHDKGTADELIVTIGGPDRSGYIYPGEEVLFEFMLSEGAMPKLSPQYVKTVFTHGWESGRIIQFFPEVRLVHGGLFQGSVPAHQILVPR